MYIYATKLTTTNNTVVRPIAPIRGYSKDLISSRQAAITITRQSHANISLITMLLGYYAF